MNQFDYQRLIFASKLSTNAKLVACVIGSHYNWKTGDLSFPSNKTIAREASISISSVTRARKELVSEGYLWSQMRYDNSCVMRPIVIQKIDIVIEDKGYSHKAEVKDTLKDTIKDTLKDTLIQTRESKDSSKESDDSFDAIKEISLSKIDKNTENVWSLFENR